MFDAFVHARVYLCVCVYFCVYVVCACACIFLCACSQLKAKKQDAEADMEEKKRLDVLKTLSQGVERWKSKEAEDEARMREKQLEEQLHNHRMKVLHMDVGLLLFRGFSSAAVVN